MLEALRLQRFIVSERSGVSAGSHPVSGGDTERGTLAPSPPVPAPLPLEVAKACEFYGFGIQQDVSANYQRAMQLHAAGKSPEQIVQEIQRGANVDGLFV